MAKVFKVFESYPRSIAEYERALLDELALAPGQDGQSDEPLTHETILAHAREEAARKVHEAYAEGLRRGIEAGRSQFLESVAESAAALRAAAVAMRQAQEEFFAAIEPQLVELAAAIAARILQRECTTDPDLIRRVVRSAIQHLVDRESVSIRVNPADLEAMRVEKISLLDEFDGLRLLTVLADDVVTRGGCVVDTTLVQVDARLETQFNQILSDLLASRMYGNDDTHVSDPSGDDDAQEVLPPPPVE
jgi:flagellar assembly protein FliH